MSGWDENLDYILEEAGDKNSTRPLVITNEI